MEACTAAEGLPRHAIANRGHVGGLKKEQEERRWDVLLAPLFSLQDIKRCPRCVDGCTLRL